MGTHNASGVEKVVVDDTMMSRIVSLAGRDEFTSPIADVKEEEDEVEWMRVWLARVTLLM